MRKKVEPTYLTKRILVRRARAGGKRAAERAMAVMGYVVVAENGWIVKKFSDGHVEKVNPIIRSSHARIVFD